MKSYFISGLGADRRIFSKLKLSDKLDISYIDWIPNRGNESLSDYALRLSEQIDTTQPYQILGVSFGGIMASEIAKIYKPEQIIIIASVPISKQLPWYYLFSGQFLMNPLLPSNLFKSSDSLKGWLFGADTPEKKLFLAEMLDRADASYLKWAIERITSWENKTRAENLFHIHGSEDRIFPMQFMKPDYTIRGAGHLMLYDDERQQELSDLINSKLLNLP